MITKKLFIREIFNDLPKTITEQKRYWKRNKEKCLEKCKLYYEENKKGYKKLLIMDTGYYLKNKKDNS